MEWMDIVEKLVIPSITFGLGFGIDHWLKYLQNKKAKLKSIEDKFRNIIDMIEKETSSISRLNFEFNIVRLDLIEYCRDYKIPRSEINNDLIDLTLFTTNDTRNAEKSQQLFSSILIKIRLCKK